MTSLKAAQKEHVATNSHIEASSKSLDRWEANVRSSALSAAICLVWLVVSHSSRIALSGHASLLAGGGGANASFVSSRWPSLWRKAEGSAQTLLIGSSGRSRTHLAASLQRRLYLCLVCSPLLHNVFCAILTQRNDEDQSENLIDSTPRLSLLRSSIPAFLVALVATYASMAGEAVKLQATRPASCATPGIVTPQMVGTELCQTKPFEPLLCSSHPRRKRALDDLRTAQLVSVTQSNHVPLHSTSRLHDFFLLHTRTLSLCLP